MKTEENFFFFKLVKIYIGIYKEKGYQFRYIK